MAAGLKKRNVHDVVLVGGFTRISILIQEFFNGKEPNRSIGAKTMILDWVQVDPSGLVKLDDFDSKIEFLAAESLHGVGGLVFDAHRNHVVNELRRRDCLTREMWKNNSLFRLAVNKATFDDIANITLGAES